MTAIIKKFIALSFITFVLLSGCASQPVPPDLVTGNWDLITADGEVVSVELSQLTSNEYYFDAQTHPISGVYLLDGQWVSMLKPDNPRMKGFNWSVRSPRYLVLVDEAPVELSGQRLISSTMEGPRY